MSNPQNNAIVVFHLDGVVDHRFCDSAYAKSTANDPDCLGWSAFVLQGMSAEEAFAVSAEIRGQVESAKTKLREHIRINAALDEQGISSDIEVRHALHESFAELRYERVRAALARSGGYANADQANMSDDARIVQAISTCNVPLDAGLRNALNTAFRNLLAN